ncbi:hypothetical protein L596_013250 [Steinernema carpocapsae]|uniref:aralkylamine N-acetyltransferase n=1 Tax=Steinernema carpocapsae TaxID=34508 RepID=A0A4U5NZJ5_STECR|nr:hypothetical protein L596_013250 [Steinernema carpocapsae]
MVTIQQPLISLLISTQGLHLSLISQLTSVAQTKRKACLQIVQLEDKDKEDIHEFLLGDFLKNESLNQAVQLTADQAYRFFMDFVKLSLENPISYAFKNNNDEIVAVRLCYFLHRPENCDHDQDLPDYGFWNVNQIARFVTELESKLWDRAPLNWNKVMCVGIVSVRQDYTRQGLGLQLLTHNLDKLAGMGCQGIVTEASAMRSQQLFTKRLGYKTLVEIAHEDWLDVDGRRIFTCPDKTDRGILACKAL